MKLLVGLLIGVGLLLLYSLGFTAWANARWPAQGRFVAADGNVRLHVLDSATSGRPVLLLHGASVNARDLWTSLGPGLEDRYQVMALDRPGMGHSGRPANAHLLSEQARAAARVIEDNGRGPAIVVAQSLGSATALRLALDRPDLVAGLVLIAPASHPYPGPNAWHAQLAATPVIGPIFAWLLVPVLGPPMSEAGVQGSFGPADPPTDYAGQIGLALLFRPSQFLANGQDIVATKSEFAIQAQRYGEITAPTVILTSDQDTVVSPRIHALALAQDIPAAELVTLPGAGHAPQWTRSDACIAAVDRIATMAATAAER